MRLLFSIFFLFLTNSVFSQIILWNEDFSQPDGTTFDNGPTAWSTSYDNSGVFSVQNQVFKAENTETEGVWSSDIIDISSVNYAEVNLEIYGQINFGNIVLFRSGPDYIRCYYKLDDGPEVLFYEHESSFIDEDNSAILSKVLKGTTVQIIVRFQTTLVEQLTWGGYVPFFYDYYTIDNLTIKEVTTLYSRGSGNWRNGNNWSLNDFSAPQAPAGVYPTSREGAIIGNSNTITLNNNDEAAFLEVHSTGALNMNSNVLSMRRGGGVKVKNGGRIQNTNTNSILVFSDPFITELEVDDVSGLNIGRLRMAGGLTLNVSGAGAININNNLELHGGNNLLVSEVPFTVSGNIISSGSNNLITNNNSFTWTGAAWSNNVSLSNGTNSAFHYSRAGNQPVKTPQNTYHHLTVSGSGTKTASGNIDVEGHLTTSGSSTLNMSNNNLTLAGNLTSDGSSAVTAISRLTFDGESNQQVNGANGGQLSIGAMTLNKAVGTEVVLSKSIRVTGVTGTDLNFNSGTIRTSSTSLLYVADGVTSGGGSSNSFVDGPIIKEGNDNFTYPIGRNGYFAPLRISGLQSASNNSDTQFTAEYVNALPPDYQNTFAFSHISEIEYWNLTRNADPGNNAACFVELFFMDQGYSQIADLSDLLVAHHNGSYWEDLGAGVVTTTSVRTQNRVADFSPFTFGSSDGSNPLPVTLIDFKAKYNGDNVKVMWSTASELNNDYFTVERSYDGIRYKEIGTVKGFGTTNEEQSYAYADEGYFSGDNYYRLRQTDLDGTTEIFKPVYLRVDVLEGKNDLVLYPNPVSKTDHLVNLNVRNAAFGDDKFIDLTVINSLGEVIFEGKYPQTEISNGLQLDLGSNILSGLYFMKVVNGSTTITKRFIIR